MKRVTASLVLSILLAAAPAAGFDFGGLFGSEPEPEPAEHPWSSGRGPASEAEIRALGVPSELAEMLRNRTSGDSSLLRIGEQAPIGLVWPVRATESTKLVRDLRDELARRGFAFFVATRRFGVGPDEVGLVRAEKPLDLIARLGTPGAKAGLSSADLVARLESWNRIAEGSVLGAGVDWIEIDFDPVPTDDVLARILDEASTLAPAAVPADPAARAAVREQVVRDRRLFLHWD